MRPVIVGLGHLWQGDDALGLRCIRSLQDAGRAGEADLLLCGADLLSYTEVLRDRPVIALIDAVDCAIPAGSYVRRSWVPGRRRPGWCCDGSDSHGANIALCLAILRRLSGSAPWLFLYGVQPARVEPRFTLSEPALVGCRCVVDRVATDHPWSHPGRLQDTTWVRGLGIVPGRGGECMHGLDWMRAALAEVDRVVQQGGLSEINCLRIAVGEFSGYPVEELAFAFECLRDNTACHNARLEVRVVAAGKGIDLLEVEGV